MSAASEPRPGSATIHDIARLAGVSTASVSRALNGRPGVSDRTRAAVVEVAARYGFTGNAAARALSTGRYGRVAVMLPQVQPEYFARILAGAAQVFHDEHQALTLTTTEHDHARELQVVDSMSHSAIDGALMCLPKESHAELAALQLSGFPFVVVDPEVPIDFPSPWITGNHGAGARQAARHLVELGHRRIAVIGWGTGVLATVDRVHGLRQVLAQAGLGLDERLVRYAAHAEIADGYQAAASLLDLPPDQRPTAVFALNDNLAFGVLRAAAHRGIAVPAELSVVGFDDLETASLVTPMLTTVHQPLPEMGAYAARVLLRWIDGDAPPAMHIQLPTELVVRESTAPAPA